MPDTIGLIILGAILFYIICLAFNIFVIQRIKKAELLIDKLEMKVDSQRSWLLSLIREEKENEKDDD